MKPGQVCKYIGLVIIMMTTVFLLNACNRHSGQDEIRSAVSQLPQTLDPRYAMDAASARVNRLIYRSLVDFDEHSQPIPALASWRVLSPRLFRFTLGPEGRTFHDGRYLTAEDVAATYQSVLDLPDSPLAAEFGNISKIEVHDENTLDFFLRDADSNFPMRLILGILPLELIATNHDFSAEPVGSGPFKYVSWRQALHLERVKDKQRFRLEEVKDPTVRVLKLVRGETDILQGDLPPELVRYLQKQHSLEVQESQGTNFAYIGLNMRDPVLSNPLVRQALAHAIDREAIIQHALVSGSRLAETILPPEHWAGNADLQANAYDPGLARELLQRAGVRLPLKLVYKTSTDAQRVRLATMMQAQMHEAGIALEIRSLDWGTFFEDIKRGNFQLYSLMWVGIKTPEIYHLAFHSSAIPPTGANRGYFMDKKVDTLIAVSDWTNAAARIHEQLPYIPLWYEGQFAATQKYITGYTLQPDGNWDGLVDVRRSKLRSVFPGKNTLEGFK
ncbi:peptide/nickel transport system substrate-binding protein [Methylobacillus rhizosphaerae]|uniref:Peptide/nickel transport system substrate-binding protein n=1 Tax=Methylobacillus rhizosphaerae TaxID=551994 RepID=A0A238YCF8_9PROT|nr:ABC transporter substrate-binding protein [Methylobacillus rhizosphaerae]SNR68431.1 peptide/nickel transport system substrate-binding protein [Methylobacillus rhizosphaerae]